MQTPRCGTSVERWGLYGVRLPGPTHRQPLTEVRVGASFTLGHRAVDVDGFYDGDGVYCVRFSPDTEGTWACTTRSDAASLDGHTASFRCSVPSAGKHGPVRGGHTYHFQDGARLLYTSDAADEKEGGGRTWSGGHQTKTTKQQTAPGKNL